MYVQYNTHTQSYNTEQVEGYTLQQGTNWKYKNVNIDFKIMDDAVDAGEEGEESERMCHKNMIYKAKMKTVNVLEPELAK